MNQLILRKMNIINLRYTEDPAEITFWRVVGNLVEPNIRYLNNVEECIYSGMCFP